MKGPVLFICAVALMNTIYAKVVLNEPSRAAALCALPGSDGTLIAHEDCSTFYKCANGDAVFQACPSNLQWDPVNEVCDWPEAVNCEPKATNKEEAVSKGNANPSEAPEICAAAGSDGVLVAHEDCNKFYKCSEGIAVALNCPENLQWNSDKDICDWPQNVICRSSVLEVLQFGDFVLQFFASPSEAAEICSSPGSEGALVPHEDCSKFYLCAGGVSVAFSCPDDLVYDPKSEQCEWPRNVDCGGRNK